MKSKKINKKIVMVLACIIIPLGAFGFGYFFGNDNISNKTMGNTMIVNGEIGGTLKTADLDSNGIVPGDKIDKTIEIKPNCTTESVMRVKIQPHWGNDVNDIKHLKADFAIDISDKLIENSQKPYLYKHTDGYLYYIGTINGSDSISLVKGFKFEPGEDINDYQNKQAKINVELDIVQAKYGVCKDKWNIAKDSDFGKLLDKICKVSN